MKAKLIVGGKEIEVEISEEQLKELESKKTGYERLNANRHYYYVYGDSGVCDSSEEGDEYDDMRYANANYYSDETVAENNVRADTLMRQLRRFAVEHRETELDWNDDNADKYYIAFNYKDDGLFARHAGDNRQFGIIYFDSYKTAQLAIDTFKDELTWYFTEYKDSL